MRNGTFTDRITSCPMRFLVKVPKHSEGFASDYTLRVRWIGSTAMPWPNVKLSARAAK